MFIDTSVLSMIICSLIYSTTTGNPLSKCEMNQYFTLVTKLNNILVNDCNILPSFRRISYFHPEVSFKATKSIDRSGTHAVSVYATGFHSRDNNVRDEM